MYPTFKPPFISAHRRAVAVIVLLVAVAAVAFLSLLVSVLASFLPTPDLATLEGDPLGGLLVLATFGLWFLQFALFIAASIVFLTWLYRSHQNLQALGVQKNELGYSSGWAVGSFFVPFVCLMVPYRAVAELWRKSVASTEGDLGFFGYDASPPGYFAAWWAFWIVANIGNNIWLRTGELSGTENLMALPWLGALVRGLEIGATVFLIMVVRAIDRRQEEAKQQLQPQASMGPPPPPTSWPQSPEFSPP